MFDFAATDGKIFQRLSLDAIINECGVFIDGTTELSAPENFSSYLDLQFDMAIFARIKKCNCPPAVFRCDCKTLNGDTRRALQIAIELEATRFLKNHGFSLQYEMIGEKIKAIFVKGEERRMVIVNLCPLVDSYPVNYLWVLIRPV